MKVKELIESLRGLEEFDVVVSVRKPLSSEELAGRISKYPYDVFSTKVVEMGDIGYSSKEVLIDCTLDD